MAAAHDAHAPSAAEEAALALRGYARVAGVDEAGRGAWAGPVVAGAVILPDLRDGIPETLLDVRDSKLVPPIQRIALFDQIVGCARAVGVGAGHLGEVLKRRLGLARMIRWLSGSVLIALGLRTALPGQR